MSNLETRPAVSVSVSRRSAPPAEGPVLDELAPREVPLGGVRGILVRRTLPHRVRRTVGAWCFLDHYGSSTAPAEALMHVPSHPHTGLQTVTWLFDGEVRHRDSLGSDQLVRPGELNLMTAGHGIAHAEDSTGGAGPAGVLPPMHGLQLWVALPEEARAREPSFAHHADLPVVHRDGLQATVLIGELAGAPDGALDGALDRATSGARAYTPLIGAELVLAAGSDPSLPLDPSFEHALLAVDGDVRIDGRTVGRGSLAYLGTGRETLRLSSAGGGRAFLIGGTPFREHLVMWWNFVGRSHEDIGQARSDWEARRRFADVPGYGERLAAPALPTTRLLPR